MSREAFVTDTGLVDDYVLTITDSFFATDERYNQGQTLMLHWVGTTDNEDVPVLDREGFHPSFTCGDGWETLDGGKTASHPTKENFTRNSGMGHLINATLDIIPEGTDGDPLAADGAVPQRADIWVGCKFRMEQVEFDYGGEIGKKSRLMPTEFHGVVGEGESTAPAAPAADTSDNGGNKVLVAKLKAAAKTAGDYDEFQAKALGIDGVADDGDLLTAVLDESDSGFYATNK